MENKKQVLGLSAIILGAASSGFYLYQSHSIMAEDLPSFMLNDDFVAFVNKYGKSYATQEEFLFRQELFAQKEGLIKEWNSRSDVSHSLGHNRFSDMTEFEQKRVLGYLGLREVDTARVKSLDTKSAPDSVDWREEGAVTPVQNQGNCGSCWAFSAIGAVEGAHFITSGKLLKLSEQQCVDCVEDDMGCNGGYQEDCFYYLEEDELESEANYPYNGSSGSCFTKYDKGEVKVLSYNQVPAKSSEQLKAAIVKQPVSVTIDAGSYPFMHYFGGIITSDDCGQSLDHAVLAVGYGVENGTEYYIVKNSWGADWGEKGYVRIGVKDGAGICGIQLRAYYPTTD